MNIYSMKCPECGAGLSVPSNFDNFNCSYCGSGLTVVHEGGTVTLQQMADGISRVEETTRQTAEDVGQISKKVDDLHDWAKPKMRASEPWSKEENFKHYALVAVFVLVAIIFDLAICAISGITWGLFWAPFIAFGTWGYLSGLNDLPATLWTTGQKIISNLFVLVMVATVVVKCS